MSKPKPLPPMIVLVSLLYCLEEASSLPMMVWTWPATLPGLTIGSARSVTSGAAHGRRQKASTPVKERIAIERTLEKRMLMMVEE